MAMPPAFRTSVIQALFEGVVINISIPPTATSPRSSPWFLPSDPSPKKRTPSQITLAQVNRKLYEQVYDYVFTRKNVKIICKNLFAIAEAELFATKTFKIFEEIKALIIDPSAFSLFLPEPRPVRASSGNHLFPNLESLTTTYKFLHTP
jgi:hypothetical protein